MGELKFKVQKNRLKKYFAVLLAFATVLGSLGFDAADVFAGTLGDAEGRAVKTSAEALTSDAEVLDSGTCGTNMTWSIDKDGVLTISGSGEMWTYDRGVSGGQPWLVSDFSSSIKKVVIENGVTSISKEAFEGFNIVSVEIADSVTKIGDAAFSECDELTAISLPDGVETIEQNTFVNCDKLANVKLPANLKYLVGGFASCKSLTTIELPDGLEYIGSSAFEGCTSLTAIEIPDSVYFILTEAFKNCTGLTSVEIPKSVNGVAEDSFAGCSNLKDIYVLGNNTALGLPSLVGPDVDPIYYDVWYPNRGDIIDTAGVTIHGYANAKTYVTNSSCADIYANLCDAGTHCYSKRVTKATTTKDGSITYQCDCGLTQEGTSTEVIPRAKTVTVSKTSFLYNGKTQKPTFTIKDSQGKAISSDNYTVTYSSGCKNVGTYTAKVTFKNYYSGTVSKTFTILPKTTSIKSLSAASKGFTVKWNKQSTQTTGYQIAYATNSKFSKAVYKSVTKNSTTSLKLTKLSSKKKYYVKIRTYKTVNGKRIYSSWSTAKTVTTKK